MSDKMEKKEFKVDIPEEWIRNYGELGESVTAEMELRALWSRAGSLRSQIEKFKAEAGVLKKTDPESFDAKWNSLEKKLNACFVTWQSLEGVGTNDGMHVKVREDLSWSLKLLMGAKNAPPEDRRNNGKAGECAAVLASCCLAEVAFFVIGLFTLLIIYLFYYFK